jgi:isoleucyl-tRNA synthetase
MATILSYTAEEVWEHIPGAQKRAESVHLTLFPEVDPRYLDKGLEERWELLLQVRGEVSKALEISRQNKLIGNSLEACATLHAPEKLLSFLRQNEGQLKEFFIVSQVELASSPPAGAYRSPELEGLSILITRARGKKCERCWMYDLRVGESPSRPSLCPRCQDALSAISGGGKA